MPIISRLVSLGEISSLHVPICIVDIKCPSCKTTRKNVQPTLNQLKTIVDDYQIFRDNQQRLEWAKGTTRLLKCPKCNYSTSIQIAVHRSGAIQVTNPDINITDEWWLD